MQAKQIIGHAAVNVEEAKCKEQHSRRRKSRGAQPDKQLQSLGLTGAAPFSRFQDYKDGDVCAGHALLSGLLVHEKC